MLIFTFPHHHTAWAWGNLVLTVGAEEEAGQEGA